MARANTAEGLRFARFLMVLSSVSPLFVLWAIRGSALVPDKYFATGCAAMVLVPNLFLWCRIRTAIHLQEMRELIVGTADDHRDHLLVYLFAMLLPFYVVDLGKARDFSAHACAIAFVVFLFWHLNLHYMNIAFAVFGYRVYTIHPPQDDNPLTSRRGMVLITRRDHIPPGTEIATYRVSDTVFLETPEKC